jgi:alkylhydroperoxidase family enzyme
MPFIKTTQPGDADDTVKAMYARQQAAWGFIPNYAKVFCYRPEVMARWGRLLAEIKRPMELRTFELVTFVAAHELRNTACTLAHGKALREFFTDGQIVAIAAGEFDGVLGEAEAALLRFARQVAKDASRITSGQVQALKDLGYSDAEIFDVTATAAGRAFFTKVLDALGVEPDAPFRGLEAAFREPLAVGRPIDVREPVSLPQPLAASA